MKLQIMDIKFKSNKPLIYLTISILQLSCFFRVQSIQTSEYLGSQSNGNNEHVLLFKLPESISLQLQESKNRELNQNKYYNNNEQPKLYNNEKHLSHYPAQSNNYQITGNSNNNLEQTISLTIPLLKRPTNIQQQQQQQHQQSTTTLPTNQQPNLYNTKLNYQKQAETNLKALPLNYRYTDYQTEFVQQQQQSNFNPITRVIDLMHKQNQLDSLLDVNNQIQQNDQQQLEQLQQYLLLINRLQKENNYSQADIERQIHQFILQLKQEQQLSILRNYYQQTNEDSEKLPTQSPYLIDTTTSNPLYLLRDGRQTLNNLNYNQQSNDNILNNNSTNNSLLSKLSNSSPELLFKLRRLLKQAAASEQQRFINNNENQKFDLPLQNINYNNSVSNDDKSSLNTFLTRQNLSSHEEIKIPLVVIAMPRILSLKRNQQGSNSLPTQQQVPNNGNLTLPQLISSTIANLTGISESNNNTGSNLGAQVLDSLRSVSSNYTSLTPLGVYGNDSINGKVNNFNNISPYELLNLNNRQHYGNNEQNSNHALVESTTLNSLNQQHTMAPYAQQFNVPVATSFARPYNNNYYNQQQATYQYPPYQAKTVPLPMINENNHHLQQQQQQQLQQHQDNHNHELNANYTNDQQNSLYQTNNHQAFLYGNNNLSQIVQMVPQLNQNNAEQQLQQRQQQQQSARQVQNIGYEFQGQQNNIIQTNSNNNIYNPLKMSQLVMANSTPNYIEHNNYQTHYADSPPQSQQPIPQQSQQQQQQQQNALFVPYLALQKIYNNHLQQQQQQQQHQQQQRQFISNSQQQSNQANLSSTGQFVLPTIQPLVTQTIVDNNYGNNHLKVPTNFEQRIQSSNQINPYQTTTQQTIQHSIVNNDNSVRNFKPSAINIVEANQLLESSLSRLRPLFQINRRIQSSNIMHPQETLNRLNNRQLVNLFAINSQNFNQRNLIDRNYRDRQQIDYQQELETKIRQRNEERGPQGEIAKRVLITKGNDNENYVEQIDISESSPIKTEINFNSNDNNILNNNNNNSKKASNMLLMIV